MADNHHVRDSSSQALLPSPKRRAYTPLTAALFNDLGMELLHRSSSDVSLTSDRRFRSTFGTTPEVCAVIWNMLDPYSTMEDAASPKHLLWALMFLKVYAKESIHCAMVGGVDEKTFRKWAWYFVEHISYLEAEVVRCQLIGLV